jgi:hypothetical protein
VNVSAQHEVSSEKGQQHHQAKAADGHRPKVDVGDQEIEYSFDEFLSS